MGFPFVLTSSVYSPEGDSVWCVYNPLFDSAEEVDKSFQIS